MLRLNLGCGHQIIDGWLNVDRGVVDGVPVETHGVMRLDIVNDEWPWEPESVDRIVLHHVLDLMPDHDSQHVIEQCARVLCKGGAIRVSCADLGAGVRAAIDTEWDWFPEPRRVPDVGSLDAPRTLFQFVTQGGARKQWYTRAAFNRECLAAGLFMASTSDSFKESRYDGFVALDTRPRESWFAEAVKP